MQKAFKATDLDVVIMGEEEKKGRGVRTESWLHWRLGVGGNRLRCGRRSVREWILEAK